VRGPEAAGFFVFFPLVFAGWWLIATTVLMALAGWFSLARRFPATDEAPVLSLHMCSGMMGLGVSMSGILTLSACPSGLKVGIWRIFGPFCRPFLVPWDQLTAEPATVFFAPMTRLVFGRPPIGRLTISRSAWRRLATYAPGREHMADPQTPQGRAQLIRGLVLQWAIASVMIAAALAIPMGRAGVITRLPIALAFPMVVIGVGQIVRYLIDRR
jgi:hypothetical protein